MEECAGQTPELPDSTWCAMAATVGPVVCAISDPCTRTDTEAAWKHIKVLLSAKGLQHQKPGAGDAARSRLDAVV